MNSTILYDLKIEITLKVLNSDHQDSCCSVRLLLKCLSLLSVAKDETCEKLLEIHTPLLFKEPMVY